MRIKDLATRATKLLTGNSWLVVDNGTKVEKAAYSEAVKQGIEEYAGSTLAGSAQTVKSAIDALNSNERKIWFSPRGNQLTTDIVTYVEDIAATGKCGYHVFWSSGSNYSTVGAPVQSAMYYKVIVMHSETIYIEAYTMGTAQTRKFIKQKFANTWGEWIQVHDQNTTITEHPNITDVLTPAQDVTILHSYVSVRNGLVILDCHFSQTSTATSDRFTFKTGYTPVVLNTNIAPVFMYSNNVVSDSVLFVNPSTLTIFGASPVANQEYYFRLVYFNE